MMEGDFVQYCVNQTEYIFWNDAPISIDGENIKCIGGFVIEPGATNIASSGSKESAQNVGLQMFMGNKWFSKTKQKSLTKCIYFHRHNSFP